MKPFAQKAPTLTSSTLSKGDNLRYSSIVIEQLYKRLLRNTTDQKSKKLVQSLQSLVTARGLTLEDVLKKIQTNIQVTILFLHYIVLPLILVIIQKITNWIEEHNYSFFIRNRNRLRNNYKEFCAYYINVSLECLRECSRYS